MLSALSFLLNGRKPLLSISSRWRTAWHRFRVYDLADRIADVLCLFAPRFSLFSCLPRIGTRIAVPVGSSRAHSSDCGTHFVVTHSPDGRIYDVRTTYMRMCASGYSIPIYLYSCCLFCPFCPFFLGTVCSVHAVHKNGRRARPQDRVREEGQGTEKMIYI